MGGRGDSTFKKNDRVRETKASETRSHRSHKEITGRQASERGDPGEQSLCDSARRVLRNTGKETAASSSSSGGDEQFYKETRNDAAQYGSTSARSMGSVNEWVKEENQYVWNDRAQEYRLHPDYVEKDNSYNPYSTFSPDVDYVPYPPPPSSYVDYLYDHESSSPTSVGSGGSGKSISDQATDGSYDSEGVRVTARPRERKEPKERK